MEFEIDKQTLRDLEIFTSESGNSIYSLFNSCVTVGGRNKLESIMKNPSNDLLLLMERKTIINFFVVNKLSIPLKNYELEIVEEYLNLNTNYIANNLVSILTLKINSVFGVDQDIYKIENGIRHLSSLLVSIKGFISKLRLLDCPEVLTVLINHVDYLATNAFPNLLHLDFTNKLSANDIAKFDEKIRKIENQKIVKLIQILYELDAYHSVSNTALKHSLCFPEYKSKKDDTIEIEELHHPSISHAVGNNIIIDEDSNVVFMTGGNMSGKSSFLKSLALAIYLAHLGFPVPAKRMQTRILNGLITMLNLADNINLGYSHYYTEVMRVKESAIKLVEKKNLLIIYDELVRGTNNKDAYDASLLIIPLLVKMKHSMFFVSSHVLELGDELKKCSGITFKCFRSSLANGSLVFDYKLYNGISKDHIGLYIVEKSGIVEIIENATKNPN